MVANPASALAATVPLRSATAKESNWAPLEVDGDCSGAVLRLGPERSKFAGNSQTYYRNNIWRTKVKSAGMTCPLEVVRSAGPRRRRGSSPPSALRVSTPAG